MPINILMPALSPTMESGSLAKWLKKEGDEVKAGDIIAEIETDKATMEFEAVDEGKLGKILVPEGTENVAINEPIAVLLEEGEDESAIKDAPSPKKAEPSKEEAPKEAKAGDGDGDGDGDSKGKEDSDDKQQAKSETKESETDKGKAAQTEARDRAVTQTSARAAANGDGRIFASPLARRLAKDAGIELAQVKGSGPHGRVVKADIEAVKSGKAPLAAPAGASKAPAPSMSDATIMKIYEEGSYEVVPHDKMRQIIARRLVEAKQTIPHFYLTLDTEIDELLALRAQINAAAPRDKEGKPAWKVSVNDLIIKALAMALQRVPEANVTWTEGGMLHHKQSDVGVAVAIPNGLITPVVRNADTKRVSEIATEMKDLAGRARERRLAPHEYQGGTTAVSNLGMFGIKDFAAVINPPHATILSVGAGIETPVVRDGKVEVRTIMTVTLSTDHRAVDGALGAKFLTAFRELIEKPAGMLA